MLHLGIGITRFGHNLYHLCVRLTQIIQCFFTRLEWCLELEFFTFSLITDFSVMISKNDLAVQLEISHTKNYQKPLFKLFCRINFDTFYLFINDHNVQCNY